MFNNIGNFYNDIPSWFRRFIFSGAVLIIFLIGKDVLWPPAIKSELQAQMLKVEERALQREEIIARNLEISEVRTNILEKQIDTMSIQVNGISRYLCITDYRNAKLAGMLCDK